MKRLWIPIVLSGAAIAGAFRIIAVRRPLTAQDSAPRMRADPSFLRDSNLPETFDAPLSPASVTKTHFDYRLHPSPMRDVSNQTPNKAPEPTP